MLEDTPMTRALAYCAFHEYPDLTLPDAGVRGAAVREIAAGRLRVLWSEVEWPFEPAAMQTNAVEFHQVVSHVFARVAVAPFRLLTVFDNRQALEAFVAGHAHHFAADLDRLREFVQMECVLYLIGERQPTDPVLRANYLERKAELLRTIQQSAAQVKEALLAISPEIRIREVKSGSRLFALVRRGAEDEFRSIVEGVHIPEPVSRRTSGPWPASEFLNEAVKARRITDQ